MPFSDTRNVLNCSSGTSRRDRVALRDRSHIGRIQAGGRSNHVRQDCSAVLRQLHSVGSARSSENLTDKDVPSTGLQSLCLRGNQGEKHERNPVSRYAQSF